MCRAQGHGVLLTLESIYTTGYISTKEICRNMPFDLSISCAVQVPACLIHNTTLQSE